MTPRPATDSRRGAARRALASGIDVTLALLLAVLLTSSSGAYFARRAVVTLRIGRPGTWWTGTLPMLLGAISPLAYGFAFALLLVWAMEPLFATSPGKLLLQSEIAVPCGNRAGRLWLRFAVKTSGAWLLCVALVSGRWPLACAAVLAAAVLSLGFLAVPFGGLALHDRVAGTRVTAGGETAPSS